MRGKVYIFSGLGADERVFKNLDLATIQPNFISWIDHIGKESIESYAKRISRQIDGMNPILIGLSFGGIIAIEVAKQLPVDKLIIISSVKKKSELPFYYGILGITKIHYLIPFKILLDVGFVKNWLFGASTKEQKKILKEIVKTIKPEFGRWAIDKVLNWSNSIVPKNLYHIHGSKDRLFPLMMAKYNKVKVIKDGGHLMILNKADEIEEIIMHQIDQ